jgi:hypothetical protein
MSDRFPPLLAVASFCLFAAWALVLPINEAPDEPAHWQYARYLHDHWRLPLYAPGFEEANSPPLAYALFAPLAFDASSPDMVLGRRADGALVSVAPPRTFLNTGEDFQRYWPQRVARLLACAISTATVVFAWRAGFAAGGREIALAAALVVALLPSFAFRAGHVSNDALVACWSAATTWGIVRLVREPFAWRVALATSAALGAAYLSKISAMALGPPVAAALLLAPAPDWRTRVLRLAALLVPLAMVAPWSIRNVVLYGDPFAVEAMRHAVAHLETPRSLFSPFFLDTFPRGLARSFVGIFGWASLVMPSVVYKLYWALFAAAGAGVMLGVVRRRLDWRLVGVLALAGLGALAIVVRINLQQTQTQGRYLFPGLAAFAILLACGVHALVPLAWRARTTVALGALLAAGNLYALLAVVVPAYYPAPTRTLPTGERVMVPTLQRDLAILDGDRGFLVTGPAPAWTTRIDAQADDFAAFEVELSATAGVATQRTCLAYASGRLPAPYDPRTCADWLADGRPHRVRLPLRGRPGWAGEITHLRFEPFMAGAVASGTEVVTRDPRLVP